MRVWSFAGRNAKELVRDPLTVGFGLGFPLAVLALLTAIGHNVPSPMFALSRLTPGITVFGLAFVTLFSATVLARDRQTAFLQRLYTTPLSSADFLLGYTLPLLPLSLAQGAVCYLAALLLGLPATPWMLAALVGLLPVAVLFIALGLLCGSLLNDKQVGGICGALLTNLTAWLSGTWFDPALVGGFFRKLAEALPFLHATEWERALLAGDPAAAWPHLFPVLGYAAVFSVAACLVFLRQKKRQ